ncbi:ser/thr protein phosphatase family protein [Gigaspora margarita]|nr:ser/thr protein phosphatase family protein [Gigaspora margarita]
MPVQDYDSPAASTSVNRVNNWVGMNGGGPPYSQGNVYTNGITTGYGASLSEQPSTNHVSAQRGAPNGISVNTSNLLLRNNSTIIGTDAGKIICVADVRGNISQLNTLAQETGAVAVIHSGDFGFYENSSLDRISDKTLRHLVQYSTIIPNDLRTKFLNTDLTSIQELRRTILESDRPLLSEFPLFREGVKSLIVPVYTVWGACEDVSVLEKFRQKIYRIPNLHILDEANSHLLEIGGVSLRLFGLGGAVVQHKLFDNGEGVATIAGGHGTMWTTILQIGELVETAQKVYDTTETRVLVTHASPGREGLLTQLSVLLRADFTISAGLHFRYGISYNEFSVQRDPEAFRIKLENSRKSFYAMWESVKTQVESYIDEQQKVLLNNAFDVVNRVPLQGKEEPAFRTMWNFNLPDAAFGWVLLDIKEGRISAETKSQGFNFAYRKNNNTQLNNSINGDSQTSGIGAPTSPYNVDRTRRQQSHFQPSPALPPQPSNGGGAIPSPILTPQRSSSPESSPNIISNWKQPPVDSTTPNDLSSSAKSGISLGQDHTERPSNFLGSDNGSSSNDDHVINDITNSTSSLDHINGTSQMMWGDRPQNEAPNWTSKPVLNDDSQSPEDENVTNNEDDLSNNNNNNNNNQSQQQNQDQHNRRNKKKSFTIYVGNLSPPVTEEELKEHFESVDCLVEKVRLKHDHNTNIQLSHAYVDFQDEASIKKAITLNGKPLGSSESPLKINQFYENRFRGRGRGRGGRGGRYMNHRGYRGGHGNNNSHNNEN